MDISSTLKIKPQEKHDPAMCQILFLNLLLSFGTSTPSLAKQAAILITQLIYPQYKSLIHLSNITTCFTILIHNIIIEYHLHSSPLLTFTPSLNSSQMEPGESVIFQPVLQAYPTRHSWIITAHISLGNLE